MCLSYVCVSYVYHVYFKCVCQTCVSCVFHVCVSNVRFVCISCVWNVISNAHLTYTQEIYIYIHTFCIKTIIVVHIHIYIDTFCTWNPRHDTHTHISLQHTATHCNTLQHTSYWCCLQRCTGVGWLRLVGSIKLQVSFAEYSLFYRALLQNTPIILSSLLT